MRGISRRHFLGGATGLAVTSALAACSRGVPEPARTVADRSDQEAVVTWDTWPFYLDVDPESQTFPTLRKFESAAQISVTYREDIEDNRAFEDTVEDRLDARQDIGADLIVVTDWLAAQLIQQGYAHRLDPANVRKKSNVVPRLAAVTYDPGRAYSLPWQSGFTGIAWNRAKVSRPVTTVSDLWRADLRGRVQVLSEMRDTLGLIMLDQGADITADFGSDRFGTALEELERQLNSGQIRDATGNSYTQDLVSGEALACMAWSGDIRQLNAQHGNQWEFTLPEGGATLWTDDLLIPAGSAHRANAEILMNYYYDPVVAAQVAASIQYICPVAGAREAMLRPEPVLADDPLIFPSAAQLAAAKSFRLLTPAEEAAFTEQFAQVIGAGT